MIIAVGVDVVEVDRIKNAVDHPRWGERFRARVYTADEIAYCLKRRHYAESFAARFAAKEGVMKALGTGLSDGIGWRDIEVVRDSGRPTITLHGRATGHGTAIGVSRWHLSLSHTATYAVAYVIAEGDVASAAQ